MVKRSSANAMATLPKKILILIDYRSQFYSSTLGRGNSLNLDWIATKLRRKGYSVLVKKYSEIDFQKDNYMNFYVLYKSSEDPQLYYKDFIEDILLGFILDFKLDFFDLSKIDFECVFFILVF